MTFHSFFCLCSLSLSNALFVQSFNSQFSMQCWYWGQNWLRWRTARVSVKKKSPFLASSRLPRYSAVSQLCRNYVFNFITRWSAYDSTGKHYWSHGINSTSRNHHSALSNRTDSFSTTPNLDDQAATKNRSISLSLMRNNLKRSESHLKATKKAKKSSYWLSEIGQRFVHHSR